MDIVTVAAWHVFLVMGITHSEDMCVMQLVGSLYLQDRMM
jgi:hypothetical protein